ncbi:unnamed protein product, partial [Soboliphyme baturini]|uniref:PCAF_N domain-containing protein n=1 Tax=Soboliphyme baturini TaxID=241478 RepID=A0A183JBD4_9BILA
MVDVEQLHVSTQKEENIETKQLYFYLYHALQKCLAHG